MPELLREQDIHLALAAATKDGALEELVGHLGLPPESSDQILKVLRHREAAGSTGIGRGVAVPHCRTPLVDRLRIVFGRKLGGVPYGSIDGQPVSFIFLLVAPPNEVSNEYLPALGRIAQLTRDPQFLDRLQRVTDPAELCALINGPRT